MKYLVQLKQMTIFNEVTIEANSEKEAQEKYDDAITYGEVIGDYDGNDAHYTIKKV